MVQVEVKLKEIETNPTGDMITLIAEAKWKGGKREVRLSEMVGNFGGKTDAEIEEHLINIFRDVVRQRVGQKEELDGNKKWRRANKFIGKSFQIETHLPVTTTTKPVNPYENLIAELSSLERTPEREALIALLGRPEHIR